MTRSNCDYCCNPTELARNIDSYRAAVLNILCAINTNTEVVAEGVTTVSSCLEVTSAGAWGSIGDKITETRFYQIVAGVPTLIGTIYFNEETQAVVTGVTSGNTEPCPGANLGESCTNPIFNTICDVVTPANLGLYPEDSAHVSADRGQFTLGVANTSLATFAADGDYTPHSVSIKGIGLNTIVSDSSISQSLTPVRLEDSAFTDQQTVVMAGGVINTSLSSFSGTDQDIAPIGLGRSGAVLSVPVYDAGIAGTGAARLEDQAFSNGEGVVMAGGVRSDNLPTTTSTDGDVSQISTNRTGAVYVEVTNANSTAAAATSLLKPEDSIAVSGDMGVFALNVTNEAFGTFAATSNDYAAQAVSSKGAAYVDLQAGMRTTSLGSPIKPEDEAFADTGALMMAGAVNNESQATQFNTTNGDATPFGVDRYGALQTSCVSNGATAASLLLGAVRAEDSQIADGQAVMLAGAVNNSSLVDFNTTQLDAITVGAGSKGNIFVSLLADSNLATTLTPIRREDQAFADGEAVIMSGAQRQDTPTNLTSTDLDITPLKTNLVGALWTRPQNASTQTSAGGSAASNGNNTLIAAGTNKLKVHGFSLTTTSTTAVTCIFQSGAGGTELWRVVLQAVTGASTGANLVVPAPAWIFQTASATLLNLNLSSANAVNWSVSYSDEV